MTTHSQGPLSPLTLISGKKEFFFEKDWYDWKFAFDQSGILRELAGIQREFSWVVFQVVPGKFPLVPGFPAEIPAVDLAFLSRTKGSQRFFPDSRPYT